MPEAEYAQRNLMLQQIGRAMSARRDRDVRGQTYASLLADAPKPLAAALAKLPIGGGGDLAPPAPRSADAASADAFDAKAIQSSLKSARTLLARTRIRGKADVIEEGVAATHRRAHRQLDALGKEAADEAYHELRKSVQVHWRHMQLLSDAWPELLKVRIGVARQIAQELGMDHDFSVFAVWVETTGNDSLSRSETDLVLAACRARQAALRATSVQAAERLFMQKPSSYAAEITGCWRLSQSAAASAASKPSSAD
jgi:hypothetical protein